MLRILRPALFLLAGAAVAAAGVLQASRLPPSPPPHGVQVSDPFPASPRIAIKERIAADAAAGRLTLLEAASAFKELDAEGAPYPPETMTRFAPDGSADEGYCRMAILWVRNAAPPGLADDWSRPLEAELDARLRDGPPRLSDCRAESVPPSATAP